MHDAIGILKLAGGALHTVTDSLTGACMRIAGECIEVSSGHAEAVLQAACEVITKHECMLKTLEAFMALYAGSGQRHDKPPVPTQLLRLTDVAASLCAVAEGAFPPGELPTKLYVSLVDTQLLLTDFICGYMKRVEDHSQSASCFLARLRGHLWQSCITRLSIFRNLFRFLTISLVISIDHHSK